MKYILPILILILLLPLSSYAETSIALKGGYTWWNESKDSPYAGNTIMDNEKSCGAYLRYENDWIYRLDIERLETGNTFSQSIGIAYEKVDFTITPITFQMGKRWNRFYLLGGVAYLINDIEVEKYTPYPFNESIDNSWGFVATLGYDFMITKNLYLFLEGRYLHSKASVYVDSVEQYKENLSNLGGSVGIGWRW